MIGFGRGPVGRRSTRLELVSLESRDVPAQWYGVTLESPSQGTVGSSDLTITDGGLETVSGAAGDSVTVFADNPIDAIRLALQGEITTGGTTYAFTSDTVGTTPTQRFPFLIQPTDSGSQILLEDLAGAPSISDWDYNDASWKVSVTLLAEPTFDVDSKATVLPVSDEVIRDHIKKGVAEVGGYDKNGKRFPLTGTGGHFGPYPVEKVDKTITVKNPAKTIVVTIETTTEPIGDTTKHGKNPHEVRIVGKIVKVAENGVEKPVTDAKDDGKPITVDGKDRETRKTQFPNELTDAQLKQIVNDAMNAAAAKLKAGDKTGSTGNKNSRQEPIDPAKPNGPKKTINSGFTEVEVLNPLLTPPNNKMKVIVYWEYDTHTKQLRVTNCVPQL